MTDQIPPIPQKVQDDLENLYKKSDIPYIFARAWQDQRRDLRDVSPAIRPAILVIRSYYQKSSPTAIGGHSQIVGSDEDWFRVWNG